jgi:hypothetical protein
VSDAPEGVLLPHWLIASSYLAQDTYTPIAAKSDASARIGLIRIDDTLVDALSSATNLSSRRAPQDL